MYVNVFKTQTPPLLCTNKGLNPNFPGTLIAVQFLEKVGDAAYYSIVSFFKFN